MRTTIALILSTLATLSLTPLPCHALPDCVPLPHAAARLYSPSGSLGDSVSDCCTMGAVDVCGRSDSGEDIVIDLSESTLRGLKSPGDTGATVSHRAMQHMHTIAARALGADSALARGLSTFLDASGSGNGDDDADAESTNERKSVASVRTKRPLQDSNVRTPAATMTVGPGHGTAQAIMPSGHIVTCTYTGATLGSGATLATVDALVVEKLGPNANRLSQSLAVVSGRIPPFDWDGPLCARPLQRFHMRLCVAQGTVSGEAIVGMLSAPGRLVALTNLGLSSKPRGALATMLPWTDRAVYTYAAKLEITVDPSTGGYAVTATSGIGAVATPNWPVIKFEFKNVRIGEVQ